MGINRSPGLRCGLFAIFCIACAPALWADSYPTLKREPIFEQTLPAGSPIPRIVKSARIRFAPGQPSGAHLHPVSVAGVVTQGEFIFQIDGRPSRTLHTGDAFLEPAGAHILRFDNASETTGAEIVAFYLTDDARRPLIQMLDPEHK